MARLNIAMGFLSGPAVTGLKKVNTAVGKTTKVVGRMNKALATFGVGFSVVIVISQLKKLQALAVEQARAQEQIAQGLKSTGFAAGFTAEQLFEMAAGLQRVTLFGDEAILRMQGVLLTFTKIGRETFPQATEAVLNIATAMRTDLQSAALQVGKALNDPIRGIDGLSRAGIQFSDVQKEVIKGLAETGRVAQAQAIIIAELNTQFGDRARADAKALGSEWTKLGNSLGDLGEKVGAAAGGFDFLAKAIRQSIFGVEAAQASVETLAFQYSELGKEITVNLATAFDETKVQSILSADAMDEVTASTIKTEAEIKKLADELERANKEWVNHALALHEAAQELKEYHLEVLRGSVAELPTNLIGGDAPVLIEEGIVEGVSAGAQEAEEILTQMWREQAAFARANFQATAVAIARILAAALREGLQNGFDREGVDQLITDLGAELGAAAGAGIGFMLGGPVGAAIGEAFGRVIGEAAGDVLGDIISGIGEGAPQEGVLNFGPGGGSITTQFQFGGLVEAMDHINELLRQLEQIAGGSIELTQSVSIHVDEFGEIWVNILDQMGNVVQTMGGFDNLGQAAEAALIELLKTASLSADIKQAFQDLIGNATDINELFASLRFVETLTVELNRMGTSGQRAAQAIRDTLAEYRRLENQIMEMGLSADATAELLEKVAKAEARRRLELELGVLLELSKIAEHFGVQSSLIRKAAILEVKLKFLGLKLQLQALGLWERFGSLWRELFRLAKQEARKAGEGFASGSGGFRNFGAGTETTLHGTEAVVTAKEGTNLLGAVHAIARGAGSGAIFQKAADRIVASNDRLALALRRNQTIMPSLAQHAALTKV